MRDSINDRPSGKVSEGEYPEDRLVAPPQLQEGRPSSPHISALDGVRGLAILAVMASHGWFFFKTVSDGWYFFPIRAGWAGVDLFFVLSGYLITGILIRTKTAKKRARTFYMRRTLRIFPLYYGVLFAIFVGVHFSWWLRSMVPMNSWNNWLVYLLYVQNWAILWNDQIWKTNIIGHFWSLAVEEQFYLVWPWIVWAFSPKVVFRLSLLGMFGALVLRSAIWNLAPGLFAYQMFLTPTRGEGLLMGAALAAYSAQHRIVPKRSLAFMAVIGSGIISVILAINPGAFQTGVGNVYVFTIGITGFCLISGAIVGSAQHRVPILTKVLNQPWLISFGKYSYGIYVYHHIVYLVTLHVLHARFQFLTRIRYAVPLLLVDVSLSYAVAWISFQTLEKPFLRLKERYRTERSVRLIAARVT